MKKMMSLLLVCSLSLASTSMAQESSTLKKDSERRIFSAELFNQNIKKGQKKLSEEQIPTISEINKALKGLKATKDSPVVKKDLGDGFSVSLSVSSTQSKPSPQEVSTEKAVNQSTTAKGNLSVDYFGVQVVSFRISNSFTYDGKKIVKFQDPPSATASGSVVYGWSGEVTEKSINDIDPSAKDAIADASFTHLFGGSLSGHLELRFTGTGNYYLHDSEIN